MADYTLHFNPENGSQVDKLSEIIISCEDGIEWNTNSVMYFHVFDQGGNIAAGVWSAQVKEVDPSDGAKIISYSLPLLNNDNYDTDERITLTEPGEYHFTIPAGSFYLGGSHDNGNEATTITFTVVSGEPDPADHNITYDPANNATVSSLHKIHFYCADGFKPNTDASNVTVVAVPQEEIVAHGLTWNDNRATPDGFATEIILTLDRTITTQGTITVNIPQGALYFNGNTINYAITLTYTVDGTADKTVTIHRTDGDVLLTLPALPRGSKGKYTLGQDDYITLPLTLQTPIVFTVGDYVDLSTMNNATNLWARFAKRYEIVQLPQPSWSNTTSAYEYTLRLDAYYMAWQTKIFKYIPENGTAEASWDLTATLDTHLNILLRNLAENNYTYNGEAFTYDIDGTVDNTALPLSYENTNIIDALTMMAEAWDTDWWVTDNIIHFGRCEQGDSVTLTIGQEVQQMSRSDSAGTYATRLYAFGSDRNIPVTYHKTLAPFTVTFRDGSFISDQGRNLTTDMFPASALHNTTRAVAFNNFTNDSHFIIPYASNDNVTEQFSTTTVDAGYHTYTPNDGYITVTASVGCQLQLDITVYATFTSSTTPNNHDATVVTTTTNCYLTANESYVLALPTTTEFYTAEESTVWIDLAWKFRNWDDSSAAGGTITVLRNTAPSIITNNTLFWGKVFDYTIYADTTVTFLTGALAGQTFTGYACNLNSDGYECATFVSDVACACAVGDTFVFNNLVASNVPTSWYTYDNDTVLTNGIVSDRLRMPDGIAYIDGYRYLNGNRVYLGSDGYNDANSTPMPDAEAIEQVITVDDIYPRTQTTVSEVTSYTSEITDADGQPTGQCQQYYRVQLRSFTFSADYCLAGQELTLTFTSGKLNGMTFEVNFNPDGVAESSSAAQWFELLANDTYGRTLPDDTLYPETGDTCVLAGWDVSYMSDLGLVEAAEQELYNYAIDYMTKTMVDDGTYSIVLYPAWVYDDIITRTYDVGQRITIVNPSLFATVNHARDSRVLGIELALDIPYDSPTYSVGESTKYSRIGELESKVDSITYRGTTYTAAAATSGNADIYVIKTNDSTPPSNSNVYSAQRSAAEFLRKTADDVTNYALTVNSTLTGNGTTRLADTYVTGSIGQTQFADGFDGYGWRLWNRDTSNADQHLTLDSLTVRKTMTVFELLIQKIRAIGGEYIISPANGRIATVATDTINTIQYYIITLEDDNEFADNDLMRCQHFTGSNIKYYWVEIYKVVGDTIYVPASEFTTDGYPEVGDEVVCCGNTTNTNRQSIILLSATEDGLPRMDLHDGIATKAFTNTHQGSNQGTLRTRVGKLDDITDDYFPTDNQPQGYGLYADNAYLRGNFVLANSGDDVATLFEVMQGNIQALITANDESNILYNSSFADSISGWGGVDIDIVYDDTIGRNVVYIRSAGDLLQEYNDYALHVDFTKDDDGYYIPRNFTLKFYARADVTNATLRIFFDGDNGDGFPASYSSPATDQRLTNEYVLYTWNFVWSGQGNITIHELDHMDDLYLYDLKLTADNVSYFTSLFSQTVGSIAAISSRVDAVQDEIATAGFVTSTTLTKDLADLADTIYGNVDTTYLKKDTAEDTYVAIDAFSGMFAAEVDGSGEGHDALVATYITKTTDKHVYTEDGEEKEQEFTTVESNVFIGADKIYLEGLVTANGNFQILDDGSIIAYNGTFTGTVTANKGQIGGFTILDGNLTTTPTESGGNSNSITFTGSSREMYLSSSMIHFSRDETYSHPATTEFYAGGDILPAGMSLISPQRVEVKGTDATYGYAGIYINVSGPTPYNGDALYGNHAIYASNGDICGFRLRTRRIDTSTTLSVMDSVIFVVANGVTVSLPDGGNGDVEDGQMYFIKLCADGTMTIAISGDTDRLAYARTSYARSRTISNGVMLTIIYDAVNHLWCYYDPS